MKWGRYVLNFDSSLPSSCTALSQAFTVNWFWWHNETNDPEYSSPWTTWSETIDHVHRFILTDMGRLPFSRKSSLNFRKFPVAKRISFFGISEEGECHRESLFQLTFFPEFPGFSVLWFAVRKVWQFLSFPEPIQIIFVPFVPVSKFP